MSSENVRITQRSKIKDADKQQKYNTIHVQMLIYWYYAGSISQWNYVQLPFQMINSHISILSLSFLSQFFKFCSWRKLAIRWKVKCVIPLQECRQGVHLPSFGHEPIAGYTTKSVMHSPCGIRLTSQPQNLTAVWSVPNYTAWWQEAHRCK